MFCADNAAQRAHQDGLDAEAQYSERIARSVEHHSELIRSELTKAFEGLPHAIPYLSSRSRGVVSLRVENVSDTLLDDVLHNNAIWALFGAVLKDSKCEHVQSLKDAITAQAIKDRASDIAEWECEQ